MEATGIVSLPLENLRTLVANCVAFQNWALVSSATDAAERVYLVDLPPPEDGEYSAEELKQMRPLCRIDEFEPENGVGGDAWVADRVGDGAFIHSGKLVMDFVDNVPDEDHSDPRAAKIRFMNNVGAVLAEMLEKQGTDDGTHSYLSIHKIVRWQPWTRSMEEQHDTQGDFYRVQYVVFWSV